MISRPRREILTYSHHADKINFSFGCTVTLTGLMIAALLAVDANIILRAYQNYIYATTAPGFMVQPLLDYLFAHLPVTVFFIMAVWLVWMTRGILASFERTLGSYDQRIKTLEFRMDKVDERLDKIEVRLTNVETRLAVVEARLEIMDKKMDLLIEHLITKAA